MSRRTRFSPLALCFVFSSPALPACFEFTRPEPPALLETSVDDPALRLPPTASVTLRFSGPLADHSVDDRALLLVRGAVDDATLKKLLKPAWDAALSDRVAPLRVTVDAVDDDTARLTPRQPLAAETRYTLVVTTALEIDGARLPRVVERSFQTGPAATGAPVLSLVEPPTGAVGVVRNLRGIAVQASRPVLGAEALRLVDDESGAAVALHVDGSDVQAAGEVFRLLLDGPLQAGRRYHLDAGPGLHDEEGEAAFPLDPAPGFTTSAALRDQPPSIDSPSLIASSGCLVARWTTSPAADASLCVGKDDLAGPCAADPVLRAQHQLALPLTPDAESTVMSLSSRDESTAPPARATLAAPPCSPRTLRITEVLSRPLGSLVTQQWVEVENYGAAPASLGGLELHDEMGFNALPEVVLAQGERALVVPRDFLEDDGLDAVPAPGTQIARVAQARLGGNGIRSTTGEALALREPDGRPVSLFSTVGLKFAAGQSATRVNACDLDGAYRPTTLPAGSRSRASATPGST